MHSLTKRAARLRLRGPRSRRLRSLHSQERCLDGARVAARTGPARSAATVLPNGVREAGLAEANPTDWPPTDWPPPDGPSTGSSTTLIRPRIPSGWTALGMRGRTSGGGPRKDTDTRSSRKLSVNWRVQPSQRREAGLAGPSRLRRPTPGGCAPGGVEKAPPGPRKGRGRFRRGRKKAEAAERPGSGRAGLVRPVAVPRRAVSLPATGAQPCAGPARRPGQTPVRRGAGPAGRASESARLPVQGARAPPGRGGQCPAARPAAPLRAARHAGHGVWPAHGVQTELRAESGSGWRRLRRRHEIHQPQRCLPANPPT